MMEAGSKDEVKHVGRSGEWLVYVLLWKIVKHLIQQGYRRYIKQIND